MDTNDSCPQCDGIVTNGTSRLVQDSCGHQKCRLCLLNDEHSCKQCLNTVKNGDEIDCHTAVITYRKKPEVCDNINQVDSDISSALTAQTDEHLNDNQTKGMPNNICYDQTSFLYRCITCNISSISKLRVQFHLACAEGKQPFYCATCSKEFKLKSHYSTHMLAHQNIKPHKCVDCGKTFYEKSKLTRHRLTHNTLRPFICQECGKAFKIRENLRTHLLIHKGDKPYQCTECPLKFSHSSNLKKHLSVHTSDKSHMCDQCGKRFKLKWALTLHRRAHSKNRPNKCAMCNKSFVHQKDLIRHKLIHVESKGFRCGICGTTFKRKDNLNRHARNTHPGKKAQIIKCVDNPNAIKVITSPAGSAMARPEESISAPIPSSANDSVDEAKQQVNAPLKLAFKTPSFKNLYNIHRDYVAPQAEQVSIYERILMPRSPAGRLSASSTTPTSANVVSEVTHKEGDIICHKILASSNAPSHYETSFDNEKHAVIKNIKFKLPPQYTNLYANKTASIHLSNYQANREAMKKVADLDSIAAGSSSAATRSVIVTSNLSHTQPVAIVAQDGQLQTGLPPNTIQPPDVHWRKRTAQFLTTND